jgi:hypothetical protein
LVIYTIKNSKQIFKLQYFILLCSFSNRCKILSLHNLGSSSAYSCLEELVIINIDHLSDDRQLRTSLNFYDRTPNALTAGPSNSIRQTSLKTKWIPLMTKYLRLNSPCPNLFGVGAACLLFHSPVSVVISSLTPIYLISCLTQSSHHFLVDSSSPSFHIHVHHSSNHMLILFPHKIK